MNKKPFSYPDDINPLKGDVKADDLKKVDLNTLYEWRHEITSFLGGFADDKDYEHPLFESFAYNLIEVIVAIARHENAMNGLFSNTPGPPSEPVKFPFDEE